MKYSFTCTCGHTISVDANSRDEAVQKIKDMITPDFISAHMSEKHPGEAVPSVEDMHKMVDEKVTEAE